MPYDPVIEDLENLMRVHQWDGAFQDAIDAAKQDWRYDPGHVRVLRSREF